MSENATIPLSITPEADEYIDQLGFRTAFEQMIDYVRQHVSGVRYIKVTLEPQYDLGNEDWVLIDVLRNAALREPEDVAWEKWTDWWIKLPPEVRWHFIKHFTYGNSYDLGEELP